MWLYGLVLHIRDIFHHEIEGLKCFNETNEIFVVLIAGVVNVSRIMEETTNLAQAHPTEPLARWPANDHIYALQAMFLNEKPRVRDVTDVTQMTVTTKIVAVGLPGKFLFLYPQADRVTCHLEAQAQPSRATEKIQDNRCLFPKDLTTCTPLTCTLCWGSLRLLRVMHPPPASRLTWDLRFSAFMFIRRVSTNRAD